MRSVKHVAHTEEKRKTYRDLVAKAEAKRPLGRSRYRWDWRMLTGLIWLWIGVSSRLMSTH
jgi:hypothetical protein